MNANISTYWTALHNTQHLALHASMYTWAAEETPPGWVLDLGCEYGFGSMLITKTNTRLQVLELDIDLAALQYTKHFPLQVRGPRVHADASNLPLVTEGFTGIYLINLLHMVKEPSRILSGVNRALKPGGVAVMSIPLEAPGETMRNSPKLIQEVQSEINKSFSLVIYPQEIHGHIPPFPPQSFQIDQHNSIWIALCRKG